MCFTIGWPPDAQSKVSDKTTADELSSTTLCAHRLNFQNITDAGNPFRYTVLDGQTVDETTIPVIPVGRADKLILASDGYPLLFDSLAETETYLKDCLQTDPLCIDRHPATKGLTAGNVSFDDRTYLLLDITP